MNSRLMESQRQQLNAVLEDYSELEDISIEFDARQACVRVSISPDSKTEGLYELSDLEWYTTRDQSYTFRLGNLSRVIISPGNEKLPAEIVTTPTPSIRFMRFAASIFKASDIFEWECFPRSDIAKSKITRGVLWNYAVDNTAAEAVEQQSFMHLYKQRGRALWTIGFWFGTLQIDSGNQISIDTFLSRYPKRLAMKKV